MHNKQNSIMKGETPNICFVVKSQKKKKKKKKTLKSFRHVFICLFLLNRFLNELQARVLIICFIWVGGKIYIYACQILDFQASYLT